MHRGIFIKKKIFLFLSYILLSMHLTSVLSLVYFAFSLILHLICRYKNKAVLFIMPNVVGVAWALTSQV